ncbi:HAD family hydrolase [Exilibacterium tricleocarpae]|uniref:Histidinol-phosphatase n=1 Tax=Exilibacterium tricleocarpae TaxID=2591008 RepID=A0A545TK92_9GAMM|nr:HAD family hydrolase [Exilibacterium tricleocarpae]TQV77628.1 HAD family hydrolase [Exilibacterium tricleocarpae]
MSLAIFDLDNTLIGGDSDHLWGEFLIGRQLVDAQHYKSENDRFYRDYQTGRLDIDAFLAFSLEPLARIPMARLQELHRQFMSECIAPIRLQKSDALLQKHRRRGDDLLIITATNRFVTAPIARLLGIDDILATEPEIKDGVYTGRHVGTPCFREGKVTRLQHWLQDYPGTLQDSSFYSDSINDLPLLQKVDNPIAVDPDDKLRQHAVEHGWDIISLRK